MNDKEINNIEGLLSKVCVTSPDLTNVRMDNRLVA